MRIDLVVEGEARSVEVDLVAGTATWGDRRLAFRVVRATEDGAEVEIEGERRLIAGWPPGLAEPLSTLSVSGERVSARVTGRSVGASGHAAPTTAPAATAPPAAAPGAAGAGTAVIPPMPGKVLEVRVHDGEKVVAGQVLLVVEAMKMRNEIRAPVEGTVRDVAVSAGTNVAARTTVMRVVP